MPLLRLLAAPPVPALCVLALFLLGAMESARAETLPTFAVVVADGRITPERLEVPAGQRIKLTLRNAGRAPAEFENLDLRVEKVLAPGAASFVVVPGLKAGSYVFVDEFHADTARMQLIAR